jgi:hypothetical protein
MTFSRVGSELPEALFGPAEMMQPPAVSRSPRRRRVSSAARPASYSVAPGRTAIRLFIGHGLGIGANEPPYLGESLPGDETVVLEEGMTFAVEPLIWIPGVAGGAGVRLEDTIVVEADGGRPLTRTAFDGRLLTGDRPVRRHDAPQATGGGSPSALASNAGSHSQTSQA